MEAFLNKIETAKAPAALGPYSQAVAVQLASGSLLFVSGQLPIDAVTGLLVSGDIREATRTVLNNIQAIVEAGGSSLAKIVKMEIFLIDLNDFSAVNEVYHSYFADSAVLPARQTVQVARLPRDALLEISCIAIV